MSFDPITVLRALDGRRVAYIVIGGLGRVIQGSPRAHRWHRHRPLDARGERAKARARAPEDLNATPHRRQTAPDSTQDLAREEHLDRACQRTPASSRSSLRRRALADTTTSAARRTREPLGSGLRPSIASLGDHARMLAALGRDEDAARAATVRRLIELERQLGLGLER